MVSVRKNASPTVLPKENRRFHRTYFKSFNSRLRNFRDAAPNTMPIAMPKADAPSTFTLRITSPKQTTCGIMPSHEDRNVASIFASQKMTKPSGATLGFVVFTDGEITAGVPCLLPEAANNKNSQEFRQIELRQRLRPVPVVLRRVYRTPFLNLGFSQHSDGLFLQIYRSLLKTNYTQLLDLFDRRWKEKIRRPFVSG